MIHDGAFFPVAIQSTHLPSSRHLSEWWSADSHIRNPHYVFLCIFHLLLCMNCNKYIILSVRHYRPIFVTFSMHWLIFFYFTCQIYMTSYPPTIPHPPYPLVTEKMAAECRGCAYLLNSIILDTQLNKSAPQRLYTEHGSLATSANCLQCRYQPVSIWKTGLFFINVDASHNKVQ